VSAERGKREFGDDDHDVPAEGLRVSEVMGKIANGARIAGETYPFLAKGFDTSIAAVLASSPRLRDASRIPIDIPSVGPSAAVITAGNTDRMAGTLEDMNAVYQEMVVLTASNLALAKEQRESAAQTERFTKWMTWVSVAVAFASLGTAIAALIR
jgi:hypothetical protein